jgi:meso-butanediol dehydrogenase / (S,S)-butanediol dehydrogenase / diacetyl reductase
VGRLVDTRALVTGGTSGIGEAIVERLRSDGAAVAFTGRSAERGERVAARTGATFLQADATVAEDVERSVSGAVRELGALNALVLNAGVLHEGSLTETTDETWDAVLETNLVAPYRYTLACLPHLRAAGGGSIVVISSDAGVWVETAIGAYSVSKRALITLGQMLGTEAGKDGVRVNVVCPGDTAPGMATLTTGRVERDPSGWLLPPSGRIGTAEDVAATVAFFLSADASFCNGAVLLVDGGMRADLHSTGMLNE